MNTRLKRTTLLTPILLALLFVAAGNAFGQTFNPNTLYQISARHSGKCLDVAGGALGNGAVIIQSDCHGGENQQFALTSVDGTNTYKIIAKHSGKGLDVFGGVFSAANGVIVEQYDYNGSANQMWSVNDLRNGYYSIVARHSGKGLDVRGASTTNGTQVQQHDFLWGNHQQWKFTPVTPCRR